MARHHYRTGDAMPVTMRAPFGARLRAGPTHSQSVESYFAHVPGLKIVMPGTPEDAAGLLISAIRDNNPVLYLENKYLYRRLRRRRPARRSTRSRSARPRSSARARDVTLITYSAGVSQGVEVAEELAKDGISVEVIDIRTLVPLDVDDDRRRRCRRPRGRWCCTRPRGGWATAPRSRPRSRSSASGTSTSRWSASAAKNTPTPTSPPLEDAVVPQPAEIARDRCGEVASEP